MDDFKRRDLEERDRSSWEVIRPLRSGPPDPIRNSHPDIDHVAHAKPGIRVFPDRLYVITVISNPIRYRSRYELYRAFEKHVEESGGILYTVEMAFGNRDFEITNSGNPQHIQLRSSTELWHKENMINIGISRLPMGWKYVAWVDADISFTRPDWCQEALHQLQHYKIIQMFSHAQDVGPNYEMRPYSQFGGFAHSYRKGISFPYKKGVTYPYPGIQSKDMAQWHSGYAWAARKEAIDELGGLMDWVITGSADHNMAAALFGLVKYTVHGSVHPNFMRWMEIWQERALKHIRKNVGYMSGMIVHYWHGRKLSRGYVDRWKILVNNQVNPDIDLKRDSQGLWQLQDDDTDRSINLRDNLQEYFRARNEDSIDTE